MDRERYVIPLTGVLEPGAEAQGGKGYNLQRLVAEGLQVPGGFVVPTHAFGLMVEEAWREGAADGTLAFRFQHASLPAPVWDEIRAAAARLRRLFGGALAVRSSAVGEDSGGSSMAGQNATFLNVVDEPQLLDAVRGCYASLFSAESTAYRATLPDPFAVPAMAVVIQSLVPAQRAGVLFTVNPLNGEAGEMLLSAGWGLGETVVGGKAADTVVLDAGTGRILRTDIAQKEDIAVPMRSGRVAHRTITDHRVRMAVVDQGLANQLHALAVRVERLFGAPQDIEWAEWQGRLYVVQARPVTGVQTNKARTVWSNANVGEALPGVGTPHTWSVIRQFSRKGILHAFRGLGCFVPEEYAIVGSMRGRVYLNLSEFMSVASQIPFVSPEMLGELAGGGGAEALPGTYRPLGHVRFFANAPAAAVRFALSQALSPARVALWSQRFRDFRMRFDSTDFAALDAAELQRLYAETDAIFDETGTLMLECSGHFLAYYLAVSLCLRAFMGKHAGSFQGQLFSGLSGIRSAEPGLDLVRMALQVRVRPDLARTVLSVPPEEILESLAAGGRDARSLVLAFQAFLASHGHRANREAELSEPRWNEDPTFPLSMLQKYVSAPELPDPVELVLQRGRQRERVTNEVLSRIPSFIRPAFATLLRRSQASARTREELRSHVVLTIGFYRRLALEVGRRMVASGHLGKVDDAFFLTQEEHRRHLARPLAIGETRLAAGARAQAYSVLASLPDLPPWFVMDGDRVAASPCMTGEGLELPGLAGAPGIASGKVVVVRSPKESAKVSPGSILVAPSTDVGWTPLFLVVAGVITELGGPLSHSCVVAREYGVPAVVNVQGACSRLRDGDEVTLDGGRGVVVVARRRTTGPNQAQP